MKGATVMKKHRVPAWSNKEVTYRVRDLGIVFVSGSNMLVRSGDVCKSRE
jgi:predicted deacylase